MILVNIITNIDSSVVGAISSAFSHFSVVDQACAKNFLGFPHWYEFLDVKKANDCVPTISKLKDFWLIGLAAIDILLRFAMLVAIFFVVFAGVQYSNSGANADKLRNAKNTLIDALAGLGISLVATAVVTFLARSISQ